MESSEELGEVSLAWNGAKGLFRAVCLARLYVELRATAAMLLRGSTAFSGKRGKREEERGRIESRSQPAEGAAKEQILQRGNKPPTELRPRLQEQVI
jgi:hypothetical protein